MLGDKVFKRGTVIKEPESPRVWSSRPQVRSGNPFAVRKAHGSKVREDSPTDASEEISPYYSNFLVHLYRASTGFTHGMFDSANSTTCGSRLTQTD